MECEYCGLELTGIVKEEYKQMKQNNEDIEIYLCNDCLEEVIIKGVKND